tara:strand:+ start:1915 stop:2409 length:495 start_codon:yes stop_codon:yes gene_type:complete
VVILKSIETEPEQDIEYKNPHWREEIIQSLDLHKELFYDTIWAMSLTAFDKPREVQVLIDAKGHPFISVGSPGFVSFKGQDDELYEQNAKMQFPLKEWVHTHPFGKAFFSGTDLRTIAIYRNHMKEATVLGDAERMTIKFGVGYNGEDYQEFVQHAFITGEEEE